MPSIRRPRYLDEEVLFDLLDYLGLEYPDAVDISTRHGSQRTRGLSARTPIGGEYGRGDERETSESYSIRTRPARWLNQVIDTLDSEEGLTRLPSSNVEAVSKDAPVEIKGTFAISPVSDAARLVGPIVTALVQDPSLREPPLDLLQAILEDRDGQAEEIVATLDAGMTGRCLMRLRSECLVRCSGNGPNLVWGHARHASRITVQVTHEGERVRLWVRDDGDGGAPAGNAAGFGLIGMAERAALLSGTLQAGPGSGHGWTVEVVLPSGRG